MHTHAIFGAAGGSTVLAVERALQWVRTDDAASTFSLLGSLALAAYTWYMARRAENTRARIEEERLLSEARREQKRLDDDAKRDSFLADALASFQAHRIEAGAAPVPSASNP
jgi:hypothetical protein